MNSLRRITASIMSSVEGVVGKLENHEALVTAAIREAEHSSGKAKARLGRVQKDGVDMRKRVEELREQAALWEERAKRVATQDETKALECIKRRQHYASQAKSLEEQAAHHAKLERQLNTDLVTVNEKLKSLRQQRNILRTRESRAEALRAVSSIESSTIGEIDDIFDRWEARIAACEEHVDSAESCQQDDLSIEFTSKEEEQELRAVLASLVTVKSQ
jgi:phage shock protein A